MNAEKVWLLAAVPLRNSCRWTLYGRRRRLRPSAFPLVKVALWAAVLALLICVAPLELAAPVRSLFERRGVSAGSLGAVAWLLVGGLSLLLGFVAAFGVTLEPMLARDEVLLALPLRKREVVAAKLLSLEMEGLFWVLLLAYPAVVLYLGLLGSGVGAHLWSFLLAAVLHTSLSSIGIGLAHLVMLLLPSANRANVVARAFCGALLGVGLGVFAFRKASHVSGGSADLVGLATAISGSRFSPTHLPLDLSTAGPSGAGCAGLAFLLLCAAVAFAGALAVMMASYEKVFAPDGTRR